MGEQVEGEGDRFAWFYKDPITHGIADLPTYGFHSPVRHGELPKAFFGKGVSRAAIAVCTVQSEENALTLHHARTCVVTSLRCESTLRPTRAHTRPM